MQRLGPVGSALFHCIVFSTATFYFQVFFKKADRSLCMKNLLTIMAFLFLFGSPSTGFTQSMWGPRDDCQGIAGPGNCRKLKKVLEKQDELHGKTIEAIDELRGKLAIDELSGKLDLILKEIEAMKGNVKVPSSRVDEPIENRK